MSNYAQNTIYLCPTDKKHVCSWEGKNEEIYQHFIEEHEDLLLQDNEITIDFREQSENRLLFYNDEFYLVQTKIVENELAIFLRYLGPAHLAEKISYNIKLSDNNEKEFNDVIVRNGAYVISLEDGVDKVKCVFHITVPEVANTTDEVLEEANPEEISIAVEAVDDVKSTEDVILTEDIAISASEPYMTTEEASPTEEITDSIEEDVYRKDEDDDKFPLELRHSTRDDYYLKRTQSLDVDIRKSGLAIVKRNFSLYIKSDDTPLCSNCKKRLLPPVFLCEQQHDICGICKTNNNQCSICQTPITSEKNIDYEKKLREFKYPCKNLNQGCTEKPGYSEILSHEVMCTYCTYACSLDDCKFSGPFGKMKEHFKVLHPSIKIYETHIAKFHKNQRMFLVHQNGIFYCFSEEISSGIRWTVKFLGPKERCYSIKLSWGDKFSHPISRKGDCYSFELKSEDIKKYKVKNKTPMISIGMAFPQ